RIAWLTYERGQRNVYTAAAPDFMPVRLTKFLDDDGVTLSELSISDDGTIVTFVRGSEPNTVGWIANPSSNPSGPERAIWAARTNGSGAWRLTEGNGTALSPDRRTVVLPKDGQLFSALTSQPAPAKPGRGHHDKPAFIKDWGRQSAPRWSPDGT